MEIVIYFKNICKIAIVLKKIQMLKWLLPQIILTIWFNFGIYTINTVENINKQESILYSIYFVHCCKILYVCNIYQWCEI